MLPFGVKVFFFRAYMAILKVATFILPFRTPLMFVGSGSSIQLCATIASTGTQNLLIVTDAMLIQLGLLDAMQAELKKRGVNYVIYDGIKPDPTIDQIEAGVKVLKDNRCEAILAVGGGSSIDAAKIIAARATNDKPITKMTGLFRVYRSILPLYAVPTTAGTGSEVTVAAVVSAPVQKKKLPVMDLKLVPQMAALDGELARGLPAPITAATGMDALTHAVEGYISRNALKRTDKMAIAATRLIMEYLPRAVKDGANDIEARQNMALASFYAGIAFTQAGVGYVHAIAHKVGALYHTPHGLANAIIMPYVLDYSRPDCAKRLAELGELSGLKEAGDSDEVLAAKFIDKIRAMNKEFGIPEKLDKLEASDISDIADAALKEAHSTYGVPRYMDKPTCEGLVRQMLPS